MADTPAVALDPAFAAWWNARPNTWLTSQPQYLRLAEAAWNAGRAEEREACARLAEQHRVTYQLPCADGADCPGNVHGAHTHHGVPFAYLLGGDDGI